MLTTLNCQNKFGVRSKTTFCPLSESSFCLWQELKNLNQKIAHSGDHLALISNLAGDEGFEPPIMGPEPTALPLG